MARSAAARVIPAARSAAGASTGAPVTRGAVVFPRVTAVVPVLRVCVAGELKLGSGWRVLGTVVAQVRRCAPFGYLFSTGRVYCKKQLGYPQACPALRTY